MIDNRSHPRVHVARPALYFTDIYARPTVATTVDLSLGGTRIEVPHTLISGERLQISIAIRPRIIQCVGRVIHGAPLSNGRIRSGARFEAGIRFDDISREDAYSLRAYVSTLLEKRGGIGIAVAKPGKLSPEAS